MVDAQSELYTADGRSGVMSFVLRMPSTPEVPVVATPKPSEEPTVAVGRVFQSRGKQYRITGITERRPRLPIAAKRLNDGRAVRFAWNTVERALASPY